MKIWAYNLATFEIKEEEVDYVKCGRAIRKAPNTASWTKYCLFEENAKEVVITHLKLEIEARKERMKRLEDRLNELTL